jgi:hypothetical protein
MSVLLNKQMHFCYTAQVLAQESAEKCVASLREGQAVAVANILHARHSLAVTLEWIHVPHHIILLPNTSQLFVANHKAGARARLTAPKVVEHHRGDTTAQDSQALDFV